MGPKPAGWYADPVTVGAARYWDGRGWTDLVSWGERTLHDPTPAIEVDRREAVAAAATIESYVSDAADRGLITEALAARIRHDLERRSGSVATVTQTPPAREPLPAPPGPQPVRAAPIERTPPVEWARPAPLPAPIAGFRAQPSPKPAVATTRADTVEPSPRTEPIRPQPGTVSLWWRRVHESVRSDLALHGLAYLGVLLMFAGVTGLIVFSFGDIRDEFRTLAEVFVPTSFLVAAWYLGRRGASVVSAALLLLGGALIPLVVVTSLTDGAPLPPDLTGTALALSQGALCAVIAGGMAVIVRRSPSSPMRYLCGPVLWIGAGLAAAAFLDVVPTGRDVARPDALQLSVVLVAIAVTMLLITWRGDAGSLGTATLAMGLPAATAVFVLELIAAGGEGWPVASTILAGGAVVVLVDVMARRLSPQWVALTQIGIVAITAARLAVHADPAWTAAGSALVVLAIVEYSGYRRPTAAAAGAGLGATVVMLSFTLPAPGAAVTAFGIVAAWAVWRHAARPDWLPLADAYGVLPAALAAITAAEFWRLTDAAAAMLTFGVVVLAAAFVGRRRPSVAADVLWRWSIPVGSVAISVCAAVIPWGDEPGAAAAATAMAAGAVVLSAMVLGPKIWVAAATVVWSLANLACALEIGRDLQAIGLAVGGLAVVSTAIGRPRRASVHLAFVGHAAGVGAVIVPVALGWPVTCAVAAATVAWMLTTMVNEHSAAPHLVWAQKLEHRTAEELSTRSVAGFDDLPPMLTLLGVSLTALLASDAAGVVPVDDVWSGTVVGVTAVLAIVGIRLIPWHRASRVVLAWTPLILSLAPIVVIASSGLSEARRWPMIVGLALAIDVVLLAPTPRPESFAWLGWSESAVLTLLLADRAGLDPKWMDAALAGWGSIVLIGSLTADRHANGPLDTGTFVRARFLYAPATLGSIALVAGGTSGLLAGTNHEIGWTAAVLAAVVLISAVLLSLGALGGIAEMLAVVAFLLLAPWHPVEHAWTIVPCVVILLSIAWVSRDRRGASMIGRWDVASFVAAHVVAVIALSASVAHDAMSVTFVAVGLLAMGVSLTLRRWQWSAAGAALVLLGAADAGLGWLALTLLVEGVGFTVLGVRRLSVERWVLVSLGAVAISSAWVDFVVWRSWSVPWVLYVTVPGAAGVSVLAAWSTRVRRVPRELALVWTAVGAVVALGAMTLAGDADVESLPGGLTLAGGLVLLAVSAGLMVAILGSAMRWVAAVILVTAWLPTTWAVEPTTTATTFVSTGIAVMMMSLLLGAHAMAPSSRWIGPAVLASVLTQLGGAVAAVDALPNDDLLVVVLLAVAAELVAMSVIMTEPNLVIAAPAVACAAWLLFVRDAVSGDANWFTVPIGLALLVTVGLERWIRRARGGSVSGVDVVLLEFVGMSFLVSSAFARTLTGHLWNGVLAIGLGAALAAWGVVTRVRWRAAFGAGSIVLAVVLLIGVPLADAAVWQGPGLWATMLAIGLAAIVTATVLERGRARFARMMHRLDDMTEGWERAGGRSSRGAAGGSDGGASSRSMRLGPRDRLRARHESSEGARRKPGRGKFHAAH